VKYLTQHAKNLAHSHLDELLLAKSHACLTSRSTYSVNNYIRRPIGSHTVITSVLPAVRLLKKISLKKESQNPNATHAGQESRVASAHKNIAADRCSIF